MAPPALDQLSAAQLDARISSLALQADAIQSLQALAESAPSLLATTKAMKEDLGAEWNASDFVKVGKGANGGVDILLDVPDLSKTEATEVVSRTTSAGIEVGEKLEVAARALAADIKPFAESHNRILTNLKALRRQLGALGDAHDGLADLDALIGKLDTGLEFAQQLAAGSLSEDDLVDAFTDWVGLLGEIAVKASKAVPGMEQTVGAFIGTYTDAVRSMGPTIKQLGHQADTKEHWLKINDDIYRANDPQVTSLTPAPRITLGTPRRIGPLERLQQSVQADLQAAITVREANVAAEIARIDANTRAEAHQLLDKAMSEIQRTNPNAYISQTSVDLAIDLGIQNRIDLVKLEDDKPADPAAAKVWESTKEGLLAVRQELDNAWNKHQHLLTTLLPAAMAAFMAKHPHVYTPDKLARLSELGGTYTEAVRLQAGGAAAGAATGGAALVGETGRTLSPVALVGGAAALLAAIVTIAVVVAGGGGGGSEPDQTSTEAAPAETTGAVSVGDEPIIEVPSDVATLVGMGSFGPPWNEVAARGDGVDRWVADVENFPTDAGFELPADGQVARAAEAGVVATANRQWDVQGADAEGSDDDAFATIFAADVGTTEQAEALASYAAGRARQRPDGSTDVSTTLEGVEVVAFRYHLQRCPRGECVDQSPWDVYHVLFNVDRYAVLVSISLPQAPGNGPEQALEVARQLLGQSSA